MIKVVVDWEDYWDDIQDGLKVIEAMHPDQNIYDVQTMLIGRMVYLILDPEQPDEYWMVSYSPEHKAFHVWQAYSTHGDFVRRTAPIIELIARGCGATHITFATFKTKQFDAMIKRGITPEGFEKQPTLYRKELRDDQLDTDSHSE